MTTKKITKRYNKVEPEELWCLASHTARWLLPRLTQFKEVTHGRPSFLEEGVWPQVIQSMIDAFELIQRDEATWDFTPEEEMVVQRGLDNFRYFYFDLWD